MDEEEGRGDDMYADDAFSDSGHENNNNDNDDNEKDGDEQHAQKVNGRIEVLEAQLEQSLRDLQAEKAAHEATKLQLEEVSNMAVSSRQEALAIVHESPKKEDLEKYRNMAETYKAKLEEALATTELGHVSAHLKVEFVNFIEFCQKRSITVEGMDKDNLSNIDEGKCILALRAAKKGINSLVKRLAEGHFDGDSATDGNELMVRVKNLESELRMALGASEDIRALKAKLFQMVEKLRIEKEAKVRAEEESQQNKKKMLMMGDHLEKLMTHLKIEAAIKLRTIEQNRITEKSVNKLKEKCDILNKKSVAKDRLILELREGSKILEDQLRLMDEKYLELRTKLDWARENGVRKVKRAEKVAHDLRLKFALAGGTTILDKMPLPDIFQNSQYGSEVLGMGPVELGVSGGNEKGGYYSQAGSGSMVDSADGWNAIVGRAREKLPKGAKSLSSISRKGKRSGGGLSGAGASQMSNSGSLGENKEPSMDAIFEKIRRHQGQRQTWTDDKLKALADRR